MNLRVSKSLRILKNGRKIFLYHSIYGNLCKVTPTVLDLIKDSKRLNESSDKLSAQQRVAIKRLRKYGFILNEKENEAHRLCGQVAEFVDKAVKGELISNLRMNISELCNCACTYCFVRKINNEGSLRGFMTWNIANHAINNFYKFLRKNKTRKATIRFFGGEPLLNISVLLKSLNLADRLSKRYCIKTQYLVNTNGTVANNYISKIFRKFRVKVVISLDGLPEVNDRCRILKSGEGTFNLVNKNIDIFKLAGNQIFISTVITDKMSALRLNKFIDFLVSRDLKFIGINYEQCFKGYRRERMMNKVIINSIIEAKKYALRKKVILHGFWEMPLQRLIKGDLSYCGGIGKEFCVNWKGEIFPCAGIKIKLGNVVGMSNIVHKKNYLKLIKRTVGNIEGCSGCEIEGMCCGGCAAEALSINKNLYSKAPDCGRRKLIMQKLLKNIHLFKDFQ